MPADSAHFSRPSALPGVELVSVAYRDRAFPVHSHAEYVVGTVTSGAEILQAAGGDHLVATGDVLHLHPDQPHANRAVGPDTLRYNVFYLPAEALAPVLDRPLAFAGPVTRDATLAARLIDCHRALSGEADPLEQETALLAVVRALAATGAPPPPSPHTGPAIARARAYIDAHQSENFGLTTLSAAAGLSVFHLARSFKTAFGLSPLAYRNQRRITEARHRLRAGQPIADIAGELGFADQSHLTRQFQKLVGISPKRYAQQ